MKALEAASTEMATVTAELRARTAMLKKMPRNVDLVLSPGDKVRVFRGPNNRYIGRYPVIRVDGTQLFVLSKDHEMQFSAHQVLPAK